MTTLIVGSDHQVRDRLRDQLQDHGLQVTVATTAAEATAASTAHAFLVVVIDMTLTDGSGLDVLDAIRGARSTAHVIVLSASASEPDRLEAIHRGADAYVLKPFFMRELTARVLAVRRQPDPERDRFVRLGRCDIDLRTRQVSCGGQAVGLTAKEFDLLAYLAVRPSHVFSRQELLHAVWHSASEWQQSATVTEHIRRVRSKIELDPRHPAILITVRGAGYRLDLPGAAQPVPADAAPAIEPGTLVHVDGRIVYADEAAHLLFADAEPPPLVGRHLLDLVAPSSLAAAAERLADSADGRIRRSEIMQLLRSDGEQLPVEVSSSPTDWHGRPARRVQLTAISDAPARLRRLVIGVLADVTEAVIICDLNFHIRSWNAAAERIYGWPEDAVLGRHVLDILVPAGHEGAGDPASDLEQNGRWNGAVVHATRDRSSVRILGSTTVLRGDAGEPIGVVSVNRPAEIAGELRVGALDQDLVRRIEQGIADDEFVVHYQPVVDLRDQGLQALEALVRWQHPTRGILAPAAFLDAAERSGTIVELGELVLEKACRQAALWRREGADIRLSVNISTRQLADPGVSGRVVDILRRTGLSPDCLWLEVTETALVEELEKASNVLQTLAELGVGMSIDDFGTGWASLTYLQSFPVHALKIDASFVTGVGRDSTSTAIVRSILGLGAELGLKVVAEGIETEAQHDILNEMGCGLGQGYFYGHPLPAAEVPIERAALIAARPRSSTLAGRRLQPALVAAGGMALAAPAASGPSAAPVRDVQRGAAERVELELVATVLRGLLRARSAPAAVDLLHRTIRQMGGTLVPAADAGERALPIDVALGEGPAVLVEVEPYTVARMQLERLLPGMVEDTRHAVDLLRRTERLQDDSLRDGLTGLANRRVLDRVLPRVVSGAVAMLDLDRFKQLNDQHGHAAGDQVLHSFGRMLGAQVRAQDTTCRIGGEEFALVLAGVDTAGALRLVERIRVAWAAEAPHGVTFSAGVAAVTADGGAAALLAADRALYRAKELGRNRSEAAPVPPPEDAT